MNLVLEEQVSHGSNANAVHEGISSDKELVLTTADCGFWMFDAWISDFGVHSM